MMRDRKETARFLRTACAALILAAAAGMCCPAEQEETEMITPQTFEEEREFVQGIWVDINSDTRLVFEGDMLTVENGFSSEEYEVRFVREYSYTYIESVPDESFFVMSRLRMEEDGSLTAWEMILDGPSRTFRFVREDRVEEELAIRDYSDEEAPKEILSDEIEEFSLVYTAGEGRDYGQRFGTEPGVWSWSITRSGRSYEYSLRATGSSYIIMHEDGTVPEAYVKGLAKLIRDLGIPAYNGYYMTNNADLPGYSLSVSYASGEELLIIAEGNAADTCVFDLAALMDYAEELVP